MWIRPRDPGWKDSDPHHCGQQDKQGHEKVHRKERRLGNTREDYERAGQACKSCKN